MNGKWKRIALVSMALTALIASSCSKYDEPPRGGGGGPLPIAALVSFDACGDYLAWIKKAALERVGPWGLNGMGGNVVMEGDVAFSRGAREDPAAGPGAASPDAASDAAGPPTSAAPLAATGDSKAAAGTATGTNNQEIGVDEADQVKTDGRRIVAVRDQRLVVVDISDGSARRGAAVDLGFAGGQFFLDGDRALVFGPAPYDESTASKVGSSEARSMRSFAPMASLTRIVEVDLSGGAAQVVGRRDVEGNVVAGRFSNGVVRLVVSTPQPAALGFVFPQDDSGQDQAEAANRAAIESSSAEDWLPASVAEDGTRTPLIACADMMHPEEFSGFTSLSVLSVPDGLDSLTATGLVADAGVTYASPTALYVATTRYPEWNEDGEIIGEAVEHTDVHRFDIATAGAAIYQASGRVEGTVLNQYAMSEHEDHLRIATTTSGQGAGREIPLTNATDLMGRMEDGVSNEAADVQSSRVTVLAMSGTKLVETGKLVGLGPTEQIQGVRFTGDRGYVVTFRQTDPLYVLDLADPTAPKVLGELKVTGFSDYLHPVGDGRLLGVGVDAGDDGRQQGAKISLYDASDPTAPKELSKLTYANAWFQPGNDPHAFTWDAEHATATIIGSWASPTSQYGSISGAVVVRVEGDQLIEVGRIVHDAKATHPVTPPTPTTTTSTTTTTMAPTTTTTTVPSTTEAPSTTVPPTTVRPTTTVQPTTTAPEDGSGRAGSSEISTEPAPSSIAPDMYVQPEFTLVPIERTLLAGGRLWAISMLGLSGHDPVTLTEVAWTNWS